MIAQVDKKVNIQKHFALDLQSAYAWLRGKDSNQ